MLSFPIPVKSPEKGHCAEELSFKGHKLAKLLTDLNYNWDKYGDNFHFDPMIQSLLPDKLSLGAFGQSGAALGHLKINQICKGDVFLFFGTFCESYFENDKLKRYAMMHPFHAIWGFLEVDELIDIDPSQSDIENQLLKTYTSLMYHPHIQNRELYKHKNIIYIGKNYGTFRYDQSLRLSKNNFKKSIWELPQDFREVKISHVKPSDIQKDPPRVDLVTACKGQEFVLKKPNEGILKWLNSIKKLKIS